MVNRDIEINFDLQPLIPDHYIPDDINEDYKDPFSDLFDTTAVDDERVDFNNNNNNHSTNYLSVDPLSVVHKNETPVFNDVSLFQNDAIRYLEQQSLHGNNNVSIDASIQYSEQQVQNSFSHPQNHISNDGFSISSYIHSENITQTPLIPSSSQQSATSSLSHHTSRMILGSEVGMDDLLSNEHINYNTFSPYVCLSAGFLYNSSASVPSIEYCNHDHLDQELCHYCMTYGSNISNNNGWNQCAPSYAFSNHYCYTNQYVMPSLYMNNGTHVIDNIPRSSNFNNNHQNNMVVNNYDINFNYNNYPSTSKIDITHSDFISNNSKYETPDRSSPETNFNSMNKDKGKGIAKCNKKKPKCPVCSLEINRIQDVRRHLKTHNGAKPFTCPHCYRKFARNDSLNRHINSPMGCKKLKKNQ